MWCKSRDNRWAAWLVVVGLGLVATSPLFAQEPKLRFPKDHMTHEWTYRCPDSVLAVACSPDGKTLASAGHMGRVKLWDVETGKEKITLKIENQESAYSVAFTPDGKTLASGSDGKIKLWDVNSGKEKATLKGRPPWEENGNLYRERVWSVSFSPDGKTLASSGHGTIRLWDVQTGKEKATLEVKEMEWFYSVAYSPDGKTLASAYTDRTTKGTIKLWDVETGKEKATLKAGTHFLYSVTFSPDGKILASGGCIYKAIPPYGFGEIKLWDVETGKEKATLEGHKRTVFCVVFSPDGKTLASGSEDKTIKLWDVKTGKEQATIQAGSVDRLDDVTSVVYCLGGKNLASGMETGTVMLWELQPDKGKAK